MNATVPIYHVRQLIKPLYCALRKRFKGGAVSEAWRMCHLWRGHSPSSGLYIPEYLVLYGVNQKSATRGLGRMIDFIAPRARLFYTTD